MKRAEECMHDGDTARVELAFLAVLFCRLSNAHIRTGTGWVGTSAGGVVAWEPLVSGQDQLPIRAS
jgi:hypothetical protein